MIDSLFDELVLYWNALLDEMPILKTSPTEMRNHAADTALRDHVLFWPIGQELMADVARDLLNYRQAHPESPRPESIGNALSGLGALEWDFHSVPWRHLLLIPDNEEMTNWRIRSEERKAAQVVARRIVKWQIGLDELAESEILDLRRTWELLLLPALAAEKIDELWTAIEEGVIR